jgi:hypothetical protein
LWFVGALLGGWGEKALFDSYTGQGVTIGALACVLVFTGLGGLDR